MGVDGRLPLTVEYPCELKYMIIIMPVVLYWFDSVLSSRGNNFYEQFYRLLVNNININTASICGVLCL
mgnify:CR=1 FL=1